MTPRPSSAGSQAPDPPKPTAETTSAAASSPTVTKRSQPGVSQLQPRWASHARVPVADAVAVIAPRQTPAKRTGRPHHVKGTDDEPRP
jgi:hypothetical protein